MPYKPSSKRICLLLLSCLLIGNVLFLPVRAKGAEVFVSPSGNDNWSGRLAQANSGKTDGPLATPAAALEAARKVGAGQPRRIVLQAGEYFLDTSLVLDPEDNGVEISAADGEKVVLFGGRNISGWRKEGKRFFTANLPGVKEGSWDFRVLIVNGRYCRRARLPETGTFQHLSEFRVPWMSSTCLLYTSPSPRDRTRSRMPSSA